MNALPKKMKISLLAFFLLTLFFYSVAQSSQEKYSIIFYNVENLFDVQNDSLTNDDEFTPSGEKHWTQKRLQQKLRNISKVLLSTNAWDQFALIGLCEVENKYVLNSLLHKTALSSLPLKVIHKESPDARGIDVALLYNSDHFYPLEYEFYALRNQDGSIRQSREILYAKGILAGSDTLHLFVNHWPSRYGGLMETRNLRNEAAKLLEEKVRLILKNNSKSNIVVMGDFNDQPEDISMSKCLNAKVLKGEADNDKLYNLSYNWLERGFGTLKYKSRWFVFDQFIVSGNLLNAKEGLYTKTGWAVVGRQDFLFMEDSTHGGKKPNRTYSGYKYLGGFSDHLPIKLQLAVR